MKRGALIAGAALLLALSVSVDLVSLAGLELNGGDISTFALGCLATAHFASSNRWGARGRRVVATLLAGASLALTVILRLPAEGISMATWGFFETVAFTCVLGSIARRATPGDALPMAALFAAIVIAPARIGDLDAVTWMTLTTIAGVSVVTFGLFRRAGEVRFAHAVRSVRNDERRAMARDLHDDVAHHVTGIIVMAQAADHVFDLDPAAARQAIRSIERSAIHTLESMRSTVSTLRDDGMDNHRAPITPVSEYHLSDVVDDFTRSTAIPTSLRLACSEIPVGHEQAMLRITREAFTNIRRHAVEASRVEVVVREEPEGFRLTVTDDGRHSAPSNTAHNRGFGGGFGLIGLDERTAAFGGTLTAGPTDPNGWRVEATLPRHASRESA